MWARCTSESDEPRHLQRLADVLIQSNLQFLLSVCDKDGSSGKQTFHQITDFAGQVKRSNMVREHE